jgi:hypothetical protein
MWVMSSFIFFKVLVKRTLNPLLPSMRTLLSLEPATTGFRTSRNRPGSEKLVHLSHLAGGELAPVVEGTGVKLNFPRDPCASSEGTIVNI